MAVDKNLFLYNLSVVSIMKNEGPYAKEWIDFNLLAGVEHFFLYDNDSTDNMKEVLQPYIDAGIVTYTFYPGKSRQMEAYIDAVHRFRFLSRFIAFIDADEFIFPQNNKTAVEVLDEIFNEHPDAAGLAVNIFNFGSNYQEKADYSKGLMERFTRRSATDWTPIAAWDGNPGGTASVKTIANPRKVKVFHVPHAPQYFETCYAINENGGFVPRYFNNPPTVDKIVMNHYSIKSHEEYIIKVRRGNADHYNSLLDEKNFTHDTGNDVFDDSILKYRDFRLSTGGGIIPPVDYQKCYSALTWYLSPMFSKYVPAEIYSGKMETFLTCRKLIEVLREKFLDDAAGNYLEETALKAIHRTLLTNVTLADLRLLFSELPEILQLDYPVVTEIRRTCMDIIPQMMHLFRINNIWGEFTDLEYLLNMLKLFDKYNS